MNGNGTHDIEDLIGKYLSGEASFDEQQSVEYWRNQSAVNQKYFEHLKLIYENSKLTDYSYDVDAAWQKVYKNINRGKTRQLLPTVIWLIAASVLLISVISYLVYWQFLSFDRESFTSETVVSTHKLPDNTEVILNRNSTAEVIYHERKKSGIIKLKGEATIKINHEENKKWLVMVDDLLIRDIGTTFNVKAYPDQNLVEVSVTEGEVQFYSKEDKGLILQAGESGIYDKTTRTFSRSTASPNVQSYHTLVFTFDDVDLKTIIDQLSLVYNRKITLTENLYPCRLTVEFNQENLETILAIIAETLNLTVNDTGNEIIISGEGCP